MSPFAAFALFTVSVPFVIPEAMVTVFVGMKEAVSLICIHGVGKPAPSRGMGPGWGPHFAAVTRLRLQSSHLRYNQRPSALALRLAQSAFCHLIVSADIGRAII